MRPTPLGSPCVRVAVLLAVPTLCAAVAAADQMPVVKVDMRTASVAAAPVEVDNDTAVVVEIAKTTYQSCTVETEQKPLPAPVNPLGQILALLNPTVIGGPSPSPSAAVNPPDRASSVPVPKGNETMEAELKALGEASKLAFDDVNIHRTALRVLVFALPKRLACDGDACRNETTASGVLALLRQQLGDLVDTPAAPVAALTARAAALSKILIDKAAQVKTPEEAAWLKDAFARLDASQRYLDAISERRQAITKAKEALVPVLDRIDAFTPRTVQKIPIAVARNTRTIVTVKCTNAITLEPKIYNISNNVVDAQDIPAVTTTVTYQNVPWAVVTAGVLYSQLDKRQVGAAAFKTGTDANGTATFERRVAQTDHAQTQLVPFSFLNVAACRCRRWMPTGSFGFGLNTNNGGKLLEYFVGGGIIINQQFGVQIGRHLGSRQEPTNGFSEGDALPEKLTTVPTERRKAGAFAIGLTFRVPLPK